MNPSITAQAAQSAAQGQQMLSQDQATAANSQNQYNGYAAQTSQANQNLQNYTQYMQGAGSGQNVYNNELGQLQSQYDPNLQGQLSGANQSLFQLTGAQNAANQQFNNPGGVGQYGLSAAALGGYEQSVMNPLQTGVANANTQVNALNGQLGTLMTGANQATTSQVQGEQTTAQALNSAVTNYQAQASAALQNMQFYSGLASTQGGLNATNAQAYASAQQGYADAQNALAQIKLYAAQSNQANAQAGYLGAQTVGQGITNTASQNQLNSTEASTQAKAQALSNSEYQAMQGTPKASTPAAKKSSPSFVSDLMSKI